MSDLLFATLEAKTFIILATALGLCYAGAQATIMYFRSAAKRGAAYVTAGKNKQGELDLSIDKKLFSKLFYPALLINIAAFLFLIIADDISVRLFAFALFALTDGLTIGLVLLSIDENLGSRVLLLTALATAAAGSVGYLSGIDLSWLGTYLFFALLLLIAISFVRLFIRIGGLRRRVIAFFGIALFVGYLLYDFNLLKAAKGVAALNTWGTAIDISTSIYLDIINLFLQILDLLSSDN